MNDERTPYLNLPLPHIDHLLQDDVERLRAALTLLDGHAATTARQWAETLAERDITQARQLQEALAELTLLLDAALSQRADELAQADDALDERIQRLDTQTRQRLDDVETGTHVLRRRQRQHRLERVMHLEIP